MNTPFNCLTCGAAFHQYNSRQQYCSAACRNKAVYAKRKHLLVNAQRLLSITEQLASSQEQVKDLVTQVRAMKQLEQDNEVLRAKVTQLTTESLPSAYHIELRKASITQILDGPYDNFFLDGYGNKTISIDEMYLITYSKDGTLINEQQLKCNEELLYLMELNNITDIGLMPCGNKSITRRCE